MAPPTFDAALGATVLSAETEIPWDLGRLAGSIAFDRRSETAALPDAPSTHRSGRLPAAPDPLSLGSVALHTHPCH